jgi:hypothetical protein
MAHHVEIPEDIDIPSSSLWSKWPIPLAVGVLGIAGTFATIGSNKEHIAYSYLFAFMFALSIALGCLGFVLIQHAVRAGWSVTVRRIAENAAMTLPVFAILFIPIALLAHDIFAWTHEEHLDDILKAKAPYLNLNFFYVRAAVYFVVWTGLAWFFYSKSKAQDRGGQHALTKQMWFLSGVGILLFGLTQTFAAFDWLMSLQPHWYSTIFGVYFFAGSIIGAYAFMTLVSKGLQNAGLMKTAMTTEHYHDLGKFLFGKTVFWAYIGFSQFFLIWYANIPEETEFFIHRMHHGWGVITWAMPITHFFLPFFFLLSRHVKRHPVGIIVGAVYLMAVHIIDIYWLVMPNFGAHGSGAAPHAFTDVWIDIAALVGVVGVFIGAFMFFLNRGKVVAIGDPRIEEALAHENF